MYIYYLLYFYSYHISIAFCIHICLSVFIIDIFAKKIGEKGFIQFNACSTYDDFAFYHRAGTMIQRTVSQ